MNKRNALVNALRCAAESYDQDASRMRWYPNAQERIAESSSQAVEARKLADEIEQGRLVVRVQIEDGTVTLVEAPDGVLVRVFDYDTEGADPADLQRDETGVPCFITEHGTDIEAK